MTAVLCARARDGASCSQVLADPSNNTVGGAQCISCPLWSISVNDQNTSSMPRRHEMVYGGLFDMRKANEIQQHSVLRAVHALAIKRAVCNLLGQRPSQNQNPAALCLVLRQETLWFHERSMRDASVSL